MPSSAELGERLESYVSDLIESGRFQSRSEILREGVRLVEEREKRMAVLDAALERGMADVDTGRSTPVATVARRLAAKYKAETNARGA